MSNDDAFAGGGLLGCDSPPGAGKSLDHLEYLNLLDAIEDGVRAQRERELSAEQAKQDADFYATVAPRYKTVMAELERKSDRSSVTYLSTFNRFAEDCFSLGLNHLPALTGTVVQYLENLRDSGASAQQLRRQKAAVSYVHRTLDYPDPTADVLVEAICHDTYRSEREPKRHVNGKH